MQAKSGFACSTKRTAKQKTNDRRPGIPSSLARLSGAARIAPKQHLPDIDGEKRDV
jgi:hypothetical protein